MALTNVQISNIALSYLGVGREISSLTGSDTSAEAQACRRFYDVSRERLLRDFDWSFARRIATLSLVGTAPNENWAYSYRYPSDALKIIKILNGSLVETRQTRQPFEIGGDDTFKLIFTDMTEASAIYVKDMTTTSSFPTDFCMALAALMAFYMAPRLAGSSYQQVQKNMLDLYVWESSRAVANQKTEDQLSEDPDSEFIRGR